MSRASFEEKSYEVPLVAQLIGGSRQLFSPGQVLENLVGFDVAMRCLSAEFWGLVGKPAPTGAVIDPSWYPPLLRPSTSELPNFSLNLFLQTKRPEKMTRSTATEWGHWSDEYFRYDIVSHQQAALEALTAGIAANGHVAYAAPALHTASELFDAIQAGRLVALSNFADVSKMTGHDRYTYAQPGTVGVALSDPERITSTAWIETLPALAQRAANRLRELPGKQDVFTVSGSAVGKAFKVGGEGLPKLGFVEGLVKRVVEASKPSQAHIETVRSFAATNLFCLSTGTTWLVGGTPARRAG